MKLKRFSEIMAVMNHLPDEIYGIMTKNLLKFSRWPRLASWIRLRKIKRGGMVLSPMKSSGWGNETHTKER
jgi:hypothetical protein